MLVAGLTGCCWEKRPLTYKAVRQWTAVYSCTLLLPVSEELELLEAPVSQSVKPRHSSVPALRVNSGVHIPWLDKQRPGRQRRRNKKKKTEKGEEDCQRTHHACGCMRISQTLGKFEDCFKPPDWAYKCLLLVNMGSVCVCFNRPGNRYLNNIPDMTVGGADQCFNQDYSQLFA